MIDLSVNQIHPFVREVVYVSLSPKGISAIVNQPIFTIDCRLYYVLSGAGKITIEDTTYSFQTGTIIYFQSGTCYQWDVEDANVIAVNFDFTSSFSLDDKIRHPIHKNYFSEEMLLEQIHFTDEERLNGPIVVQGANSFESNFRFLASEFYSNGRFRNEVLSTNLKSGLLHFLEVLEEKKDIASIHSDADQARSVVHYIQSHYKEDIDNQAICKEFGFSVTYLNKLFRNQGIGTLHSFLLDYRINIAAELMRTTDLPINSIALSSGFSDVSYFCRIFKQKKSYTPLQYRHQIVGH